VRYTERCLRRAHAPHASTEGMTQYVQILAAGLLMMKEIESLEKALVSPRQPYVAILGGAKVSDKIGSFKTSSIRFQRLCRGRDGLHFEAQDSRSANRCWRRNIFPSPGNPRGLEGQDSVSAPRRPCCPERMDVGRRAVSITETFPRDGLPRYRPATIKVSRRRSAGQKRCLERPHGRF